MHVGILDGDAEAGFQIQLAGVGFQPGFRFGDGLAANSNNVLNALVAITAFDGVKTERACGDYAIDVVSDVESPFRVQIDCLQCLCEYSRMW